MALLLQQRKDDSTNRQVSQRHNRIFFSLFMYLGSVYTLRLTCHIVAICGCWDHIKTSCANTTTITCGSNILSACLWKL